MSGAYLSVLISGRQSSQSHRCISFICICAFLSQLNAPNMCYVSQTNAKYHII